MADQDPDAKLVMKAGTCRDFLTDFRMSDDGESM
jgi:hypothetical protein